ncbi:MAG: bis(5'-nucleosyl)-tetraphosphatase (symmetrical) YqeK [Lachnospiraceae bacterium]|nr:bis(5'-nucleosyl)-tetraphosphatase (symmetrical) YqeK [Lachnospiraceae bacterium]
MDGFSTENHLYKNIQKKLKKELDKKRYVHTMGVAYTALNLAMAHGEDLGSAYLAGLLHDNAKCLSSKEKLSLCKKHGIKPNEAEAENPDLLHAKLGAALAKDRFEIEDGAVLSAICYHTTGKPDMSTLEKIVYIADYMEPNRRMLPGLPEIRGMAFKDLDQTMTKILENTLSHLKNKKIMIDPLTQETWDYYKTR